MDRDSETALKLLRSISFCHTSMKRLETQVRELPYVTKVTRWFELGDHDYGILIEDYVAAELSNGKAVDWCLVITLSSGGWDIQADVRVNDDLGQDVLTSLPVEESLTLDQAIIKVKILVTELTSMIGVIDSVL
jgi:hypothetical protein